MSIKMLKKPHAKSAFPVLFVEVEFDVLSLKQTQLTRSIARFSGLEGKFMFCGGTFLFL